MGRDSEFDVQEEYTEENRKFRSVVERSSDDDVAHGLVRGKHELHADEPEWLEEPGAGNDAHPAPADYLVFGLVSCQVEVLDQALRKARIEEYNIRASAVVDRVGEDEPAEEMLAHHAGRISHVSVDLTLEVPPEFESRAQRCLDVYDTGCVVGQSYRNGIDYTPTATLDVVE
ncbi:OsmC family protein [Halorarius halobius]|uniref:OsmC family protein n=1 Tax=Halorarius halobius TaxID=2962671 RepID=UPI0020CB6E14|nr:OsmC family protein [Halorarius halobius]